MSGSSPIGISHTTVSLIGMVCAILGALIVTFDYTQIEQLGGFDHSKTTGDAMQDALHDRLVIEFFIGVAILAAGIAMCMPRALDVMRQRLLQK